MNLYIKALSFVVNIVFILRVDTLPTFVPSNMLLSFIALVGLI